MEVEKRSYGVDVSSYNASDLSSMANSGAKFAIVKLSEGTGYQNPNAQGQIQSAKANNMLTMGYHYAHFGADSNRAVQEGNYTVNSAKSAGLQVGTYLAGDWEADDNNVTNAGRVPSANAILAFLDVIVSAGYKPLLYSGAALLKGNVDTDKVLAKYPNCLWVAAYPLGNGVPASEPNFDYFPY